jgi:hypothetical protein
MGVAWCIASAAVAFAKDAGQHSGKAGLWEVTTTMTWQKSPVPPGSPGAPPGAGTHTTSVCLNQAMVDAGALFPQSRGQCKIENKVIKPGSVTADYVCTGKMKGKGMLEATFTDLEHTSGSLHFQGTLDVGSQVKPIEWTTVSTSVLKSEQCPSDQPQAPATPKPSK